MIDATNRRFSTFSNPCMNATPTRSTPVSKSSTDLVKVLKSFSNQRLLSA
jgi:hypothetical protein